MAHLIPIGAPIAEPIPQGCVWVAAPILNGAHQSVSPGRCRMALLALLGAKVQELRHLGPQLAHGTVGWRCSTRVRAQSVPQALQIRICRLGVTQQHADVRHGVPELRPAAVQLGRVTHACSAILVLSPPVFSRIVHRRSPTGVP
jgi:hypothetical protein